ncbi:NAD(P)-dependent oxidoreductase [Curtobacterium pusillum]|uniref:NAD(P)-dependent oxidoreductase n=1 Tax=Curtobacterium pusillum TaxID=69373 RepID=A0AAW3T1V0_9MICO|nr:NAD(P)-dependent oxidoreductase [Curtobacterium pusillum]MBA8989474.1 nucleoside-diphosphate-sugar epimerase [Curtobacterium pusillum]NUU15033.1 NAD(P)-dependent oxidoreductase [Curtobacterium pusillum]GLK32595.1 epimerase [Curtobacterium pusillum]
MTAPIVPRRVLVTGASGGIGAVTTAHLASHGIAVTALDRHGVLPAEADRHVRADATDPAAVGAALEDADAVVHLAAIPHPTLGPPWEVFSTNVTATFAVLSEAGARGIRRAVIASSVNASGVPFNPRRVLPAYYPIDEDLPVDLGDPYSLSKSVDESSARTAHRMWGIDVVAFRFPLVKDHETLVAAAAHAARDPGATVREGWSYLDVRDAARAVHAALVAPIEGAHVVGLAAPDTLLPGPTEELLARWAPGVPIRSPLPGRAAAVDTSRAELLLGFRPEHTLETDPSPAEVA